nr:hypothetical protein [Candidatus Enterousia merdequi]
MYLDTEKKLNSITNNVVQEMLEKHIIDNSGKAINIPEVNKFLDSKINQCFKLLTQLEENDTIKDGYSANIIYSRITYLEALKIEVLKRNQSVSAKEQSDIKNQPNFTWVKVLKGIKTKIFTKSK